MKSSKPLSLRSFASPDVAAGMAGDSDGILRGAGEERVRVLRRRLDVPDARRGLRVRPLLRRLERVHGGRGYLASSSDVILLSRGLRLPIGGRALPRRVPRALRRAERDVSGAPEGRSLERRKLDG